MAKNVTREELTLMIEELDRGEAERGELEDMIEKLELNVPDAEALDVLENEELSAGEVADQLVGYSDLDA